MIVVGIHEAKTHLSALVERAAGGEQVLIQRRGIPVARLVPVAASASFADSFAMYPAAELEIADDFDALPEDIASAFGAQ